MRRIQANLQAAITSAPTPAHRQAKEELLRPLSLATRAPQSIPNGAPGKPTLTLNSSVGSYTAPAVPLTPQHARSGGVATAAQPSDIAAMHLRLKSHLNLRDQPSEADLARQGSESNGQSAAQKPVTLATLEGASGLQRQSSCPTNQMPLLMPAYGTPATTTYRASPLSRAASKPSSAAAPYTPTKTSRLAAPPAVAAPASSPIDDRQSQHMSKLNQARLQLLQMQVVAQQQASAQLQQMRIYQQQQHISAPGTPPVDAAVIQQQRLVGLSDPGGDQMEMLLQSSEGAHGVVHISRTSSKVVEQGTPPRAASGGVSLWKLQETPPKASSCMPHLLQKLCIPGSPAGEESPSSVYQLTPGPAGPGIKERVKWHLARQAGSNC